MLCLKHLKGLSSDTSILLRLVELSELLKLDDESMTPAQAYTAVRETVPNDKFLRPTLDALKKPLGSMVQCHGFGACMDAPS